MKEKFTCEKLESDFWTHVHVGLQYTSLMVSLVTLYLECDWFFICCCSWRSSSSSSCLRVFPIQSSVENNLPYKSSFSTTCPRNSMWGPSTCHCTSVYAMHTDLSVT